MSAAEYRGAFAQFVAGIPSIHDMGELEVAAHQFLTANPNCPLVASDLAAGFVDPVSVR